MAPKGYFLSTVCHVLGAGISAYAAYSMYVYTDRTLRPYHVPSMRYSRRGSSTRTHPMPVIFVFAVLFFMQGSPSACGWLQIPGASRV